MNPVIQKCVEELNKEAPRIDYIRGMLESLLVMNNNASTVVASKHIVYSQPPATVSATPTMSDEETTLLQAYEKGPIGKITS